MPLLALVDDQRVVSSELNAGEWQQLKEACRIKAIRVTLMCGLPGHCRTSKLGTQFFAHNAGGGDCPEHPGEGPEHLAAKAMILAAAARAGWQAAPEVRGDDGWIADVMATLGDRQVAFEVQWSSQTDFRYTERQARYADSGVRAAWFVRHSHSVPTRPTQELPIFGLDLPGSADQPGTFMATVGKSRVPLERAVEALLTGRVRFCHRVVGLGTGTNVQVRVVWNKCHRQQCGQWFIVWEVEPFLAVRGCGEGVTIRHRLHQRERPEAAPEVRTVIDQICRDEGWKAARLEIRPTLASGTEYMAFVCPHCSAVSGDAHLEERFSRGRVIASAIVPELTWTVGAALDHWCLDSGQGLCPS